MKIMRQVGEQFFRGSGVQHTVAGKRDFWKEHQRQGMEGGFESEL